MPGRQFCLKWNNYTPNMLATFHDLQQMNYFTDVTLACDGLSLEAHKLVLSACSDFFRTLFIENPCKHPVVILKDIVYKDLKSILEFMYNGEVYVSQEQLSTLLKTAETLKVKGLAEVSNKNISTPNTVLTAAVAIPSPISVASSSVPQQLRSSSPLGRLKKVRAFKLSRIDSGDTEIVLTKNNESNFSEINEISIDNNSYSHSSMPNQPHSNIRSSSVTKSSIVQNHSPSEEDPKCDIHPPHFVEETFSEGSLSSNTLAISDVFSLVSTNNNNQFPEFNNLNIKEEVLAEESVSNICNDKSSNPGPSGMHDSSALVSQDTRSQFIKMPPINLLSDQKRSNYLRKKRESARKRMAKIKCDPILAEEYKKKERLRYYRRKENGQIKPIAELPKQEQQRQREIRKIRQRQRRAKQKEIMNLNYSTSLNQCITFENLSTS